MATLPTQIPKCHPSPGMLCDFFDDFFLTWQHCCRSTSWYMTRYKNHLHLPNVALVDIIPFILVHLHTSEYPGVLFLEWATISSSLCVGFVTHRLLKSCSYWGVIGDFFNGLLLVTGPYTVVICLKDLVTILVDVEEKCIDWFYSFLMII